MSRRRSVVFLALVLTVGAVGGVAGLPSVGAQTDGGSVPMLALDSPDRAEQAVQSVDVSRAVALQRGLARSQVDRYAYEARLAGDESPDDQVILTELDRLERRVETLRLRVHTMQAEYAAGRLSTSAFLAGLARSSRQAATLSSRIAQVRQDAAARGINTSPATALASRLVGYRGPVRDRITAAVVGEKPAIRIDVTAAPNRTTLAMIADGVHVREAQLADRRTTAVTGTISSTELYGSVTNRLVSDVYDLDPKSTSIRGRGGGTYEAVIRAPRTGTYLTITALIDGDTREIFAEVQTRTLETLPPGEGVVAAANGTRLVVNRSFPGGPLRIATVDNETGSPVSTTVTVGGDRFVTGADGVRWTLAPRRFEFGVTAVAPAGNVSVRVRTIRVTAIDSTV